MRFIWLDTGRLIMHYHASIPNSSLTNFSFVLYRSFAPVTLSYKNGGPSSECSTIPLPYNLKPDIGIFFDTNKLVLKLQSIQAFVSLPAHLDDGEKRLCVIF